MCYNKVNEEGCTEVEFDYYLALANLFDQGYPTILHDHGCTPATPSPVEPGENEAEMQERVKHPHRPQGSI